MTEAESIAEHIASQLVDSRAGVAMVSLLSVLLSTVQVLEPRCPDLPIRAISEHTTKALAPWLAWSTPDDLAQARQLSDKLGPGLVGATPKIAIRSLIFAVQSVQSKLALLAVGLDPVPVLFRRAGAEAILVRAALVQLGRISGPAFDPFVWLSLTEPLS